MADEAFKELASRLQEVGKVLEKLPSEVRQDAFKLFDGYLAGTRGKAAPKQKADKKAGKPEASASTADFITQFDHDKPADNVKLIAADFYREYGTDPFSLDDIRQAADNIGLTIPGRPDMTLATTKSNGKKLFKRAAGRGMFHPTVHGEAFLKEKYSVNKGTKTRIRDDE